MEGSGREQEVCLGPIPRQICQGTIRTSKLEGSRMGTFIPRANTCIPNSPLRYIQPNGQEKTYEYTNTRDKLIIDSGEKVVNKSTKEFVPLQGNFYGSHAEPTLVRMGEVKADADGRLIFVAGDGLSYALETKDKPPSEQPPLKEKFDNDNWVASFHNTCIYPVC